MPFQMIYVTFGTEENAREVAKHLLEKQLISCANIFPAIQSIYIWKGEIKEDQEIVAIFKSRAGLFKEIEDAITSLHTYEVPCIVALPIEQAHEPFLKWIENSTSPVK